MKSNWPQLLCLALGAFAIGTESYAIAGLLPLLSGDLGVTVALAGQLITAFALAYALGSPLLAVATAESDRRVVLLVSITSFGLFNVLAALAPSYAVLFAARIGMALSAGTFMPAASAYAVAISPVERHGRSLSIIYAGLTFATVIGVPVGVLVGERLGWRSIFSGAAILALLALIGLSFNLRRVAQSTGATLAERFAIARRPDVLNALCITVVALTGAFTVYTYLAPFLAETTGLKGDAVAVVLFLFGFGSTVGNLTAGYAADRFGPDRVMTVILSSLAVLFAVLSLSAEFLPAHTARWIIIPVIGLWGLMGFSFPSTQQARLVGMAPRLAPVTISLNASAIYLGISIGAVLGSIVVAHHAVSHIGWVAVACDVVALTTLYFSPSRRAAAAQSTLLAESPAVSTLS